MRRRAYAPVEHQRLLTVSEIAAEIGRSPARTRKLLAKHHYLRLRPRRLHGAVVYEAQAVERLKAMLDQPHREVCAAGTDWLTSHLGGVNE